jgi:hypothetical protein
MLAKREKTRVAHLSSGKLRGVKPNPCEETP